MKTTNLTLILAAICLIFIVACGPQVDVEAEKAAIMEVLEAETNAWASRDYEAWKSYWTQSEGSSLLWVSPNNLFTSNSWGEIDENTKQSLADSDPIDPVDLSRDNVVAVVSSDQAWVRFNQQANFGPDGAANKTMESRHMKKVNGQWKIHALAGVNATAYEPSKILRRVVVFKPKVETTQADLDKSKAALDALMEKIDGFNSNLWMTAANPGADDAFTHTVVLDFSSIEAIQTFNQDPERLANLERAKELVDDMSINTYWVK